MIVVSLKFMLICQSYCTILIYSWFDRWFLHIENVAYDKLFVYWTFWVCFFFFFIELRTTFIEHLKNVYRLLFGGIESEVADERESERASDSTNYTLFLLIDRKYDRVSDAPFLSRSLSATNVNCLFSSCPLPNQCAFALLRFGSELSSRLDVLAYGRLFVRSFVFLFVIRRFIRFKRSAVYNSPILANENDNMIEARSTHTSAWFVNIGWDAAFPIFILNFSFDCVYRKMLIIHIVWAESVCVYKYMHRYE